MKFLIVINAKQNSMIFDIQFQIHQYGGFISMFSYFLSSSISIFLSLILCELLMAFLLYNYIFFQAFGYLFWKSIFCCSRVPHPLHHTRSTYSLNSSIPFSPKLPHSESFGHLIKVFLLKPKDKSEGNCDLARSPTKQTKLSSS